jgi:hypothetical protein
MARYDDFFNKIEKSEYEMGTDSNFKADFKNKDAYMQPYQ